MEVVVVFEFGLLLWLLIDFVLVASECRSWTGKSINSSSSVVCVYL